MLKINARFPLAQILVACCVILSVDFAVAQPLDHIGPDPIRSENCVMITPERSFVCRGKSVPPGNSETAPSITFNCGPGILVILAHETVERTSSVREITLITDDDEFTDQWLAITEKQSVLLKFYDPASANQYSWMLNLLGRLKTQGLSRFGYSFDPNEGASGVFDLDFSDRTLATQIVNACK